MLHLCGLGVAQIGHSLNQLRSQTQFYEAVRNFFSGIFFSSGVFNIHVGQHGVQTGIDFRGRHGDISSGHQALL